MSCYHSNDTDKIYDPWLVSSERTTQYLYVYWDGRVEHNIIKPLKPSILED